MHELKHRPDPEALFRQKAAMAVREKIREALREAAHDASHDASFGPLIDDLEDAVCRALADREIAWALAYIAGVQMAPEILRLASERTAP